MSKFNDRLKTLNSRISASLTKVEEFDDRLNAGDVAIWGYGFLGEWFERYFHNNNPKENLGIFDAKKVGQFSCVRNTLIRSPSSISKSNSFILIAARHNVKPISKLLDEISCQYLSLDAYFVVKLWDRYVEIIDELADEKSKISLLAILESLLDGQLENCDHLAPNMYFEPGEFYPSFDEIFIDAGAYTGDTLEKFVDLNLGTFEKIICFEPGEAQFAKLENRLEALASKWLFQADQIILERKGVGARNARLKFNTVEIDTMAHRFSSNNSNEGESAIEVLKLDDYLKGARATFLKSDVEGMDTGFLEGARETINAFKPKLAISCYHYPTDLVAMMDLLKDRHSHLGYGFKIRHHARVIGDYVLYGF